MGLEDEVKFYWECLGQKYQFDPTKKYLIYYPGCFCAPHRCHFNTINDFIYLPNANFFIHQGGREKRHGVPYHLSRKIWKIYIRELMPRDKTALLGRGRHQVSDLVFHDFTNQADTVVFIAGNEDYDPETMESYARNKKYKYFFRGLVEQGKEVVFLYLDRPSDGVSATKMSQALRDYRHVPYDDKVEFLRNFFPIGLSDKAVRYIIKKLERCDLR